VWSSTGVGSGLARKQQARVEASDGNKHCIKLQKSFIKLRLEKKQTEVLKYLLNSPNLKLN
jgi:hypothetical protein